MRVAAQAVASRIESFKEAARNAGIKLTHQRLAVFRVVASSLEHPNAESVFRAVQRNMPTISLDTVYRTLWTLSDLGVIAPLGPRRESVRFDANLAPHHHYVCMRCGLTLDFYSDALATARIPSSVERMGSIVATQVEVRGICSRCQSAQSSTNSKRKQTPVKTTRKRQ